MTNETKKTVFETLSRIDTSSFTKELDQGNNRASLTYLSWSKAWELVKGIYPSAKFEIHKKKKYDQFGNVQDELSFFETDFGIEVRVSVTIEDETQTMSLPVMNSKNKALKREGYTYDTKHYKGIKVEPVNIMDINKAQMRCLVKCLALFGLGLNIYNGEDLPMAIKEDKKKEAEELMAKRKEVAIFVHELLGEALCEKTFENVKKMKLSVCDNILTGGISKEQVIEKFKKKVDSLDDAVKLAESVEVEV